VAKGREGGRRRPHFAHKAATDCPRGYESGVHLRAKQLIVDRAELLLPGWGGDLFELQNPPRLRGSDGRVHEGRRVDMPPRRVKLKSPEPECVVGPYRADVVAHDDIGELLIEVRVTHGVDASKAAYVESNGWRMIEIDLSDLHSRVHCDPEAFEKAVLFDPENRTWISCPEALYAWRAAAEELERQVSVLAPVQHQEPARWSDMLRLCLWWIGRLADRCYRRWLAPA